MRSACADSFSMNQFSLSRAVVVVPLAVSFQVIVGDGVEVVEPCACTRNWGSVGLAGGIAVGFRQAGRARIFVSVIGPVMTLVPPLVLSQVWLSGMGSVAPTNRLKMVLAPAVVLSSVAGSGGVVSALE